MPQPNSWEVLLGGETSRAVLVVDFPSEMRQELDFAELAARIGPGYRYLMAKLPAVDRGKWPSSDAYVSTWSEDVRRAGYQVAAVFGSRVGSVYAVAIADYISHWQQRPAVIIFDPQTADIGLLNQEFSREINSLVSLFSSDEIRRSWKIWHEISESAARDITAFAAKMFEDYLKLITAPFERAGIGEPRDSKLTDHFKSYISFISAAGQIKQECSLEHSIAIISSDWLDVVDGEVPSGDRRMKFDVRRADLFRSDLVTAMISDLIRSR
jgi:hypothetical protein